MNIIEAIKVMMQSTKLFDSDDLLELRRIYIKIIVSRAPTFVLLKKELLYLQDMWKEFKSATQETLQGENV
jgi:hypothetical protein